MGTFSKGLQVFFGGLSRCYDPSVPHRLSVSLTTSI